MKASKPILHGRDHVPGGADPIFPTHVSGGFVEQVLQHPCLVHYWRMGASSGNQPDLVAGPIDLQPQTAGAAGTYNVAGALPDDGAFEFNGTGSTAGDWFMTGVGVTHRAQFDGNQPFSVELFALIHTGFVSGSANGGLVACGTSPSGWALEVATDPTPPGVGHRFRFRRQTVGLYSTLGITAGVFHHIAATYDGTVSRVYVDGTLFYSETNTTGIGGATAPISVGVAQSTPFDNYFPGRIDEVALYICELTADEIVAHATAATDPAAGGGNDGNVLTIDANGNAVWAPPTVEVTGGGIDDTTPDPTPVDTDSGPYAGTPTTGTGWHLQAHQETVLLVDSTRGRFDVPTMKWTRVPFNTVRILRTWEPTVDADVVKTAWLPDDRGLSGPARDGILHVNPDMVWSGDQLVNGWVSIEYPVLNFQGLPDDDPDVPGFGPRPEAPGPGISAPDSYMRSLRLFNLSAGSPLHLPSSGLPAYITWHFWDAASAMEAGDYPPPTYPVWAARPLHLPPPYPQLSPTDSKTYYVDGVGDPGWRFDKLTVATTLAAGANLCLQAWQDSPWLIRFSTDRFPVYHGYTDTYRGFPYLYISFAYDPDTIDHTTGKLLLPAPA